LDAQKNKFVDILLIDDDVDELAIFEEGLKQAAITYKIHYAEDPFSAEAFLILSLSDIIFVDFNMPKMDGIQCILYIRKIAGIKDIPTVLYSTSIKDDYREAAIRLDIICMPKTPDFKSLVSQLKAYFAKNDS
jgi:CheY-like chemotaxis protein